MSETCPDLLGRDYECDGGTYRREARRDGPGSVHPVQPSTRGVEDDLLGVRDDATLGERARRLVDGPRQDAYGAPEDNLTRIGQAWAAIFGMPNAIPAWRVALALCALKAVRAAHRGDDDSITDLYGYALLAERLRCIDTEVAPALRKQPGT